MADIPELKRKLSAYPASPSVFPCAATRGLWASLFATTVQVCFHVATKRPSGLLEMGLSLQGEAKEHSI